MRASELIYKSAKDKKIGTPKGKIIDYTYNDGTKEGNCFICGRHTTKGFDTSKIIKPTFTDYSYCTNKSSDTVCEYCSFSLNFSELRNYGIFATENTFIHPSIAEYKNIILNNTDTPFVLCIPVSGQKWLHIKAKVNYDAENIILNLEEQQIRFNRNEFKSLLLEVEKLYNSEYKITKDEIEHLTINNSKILKMGLEKYGSILKKLERYKNTPIMKICCYLAQKEEKEGEK